MSQENEEVVGGLHSKGLVHRTTTLICLVATAVVLLAVATSASAIRPQFVRPCGAIRALNRGISVDVVEGRFPFSCKGAREVFRRYLAIYTGTESVGSNRDIRYRGLTFGCYKARPGGNGWDYSCSYLSLHTGQWVDVGASRRWRR
jgi:hypothetical protein